MYISNEVAELMQMHLSAAEMNLLTAEVWVLARKLQEEQKRQRRRKRKRLWARSWILRRPLYEKLLNELTAEDASGYKNFLRMDPATFREILARVAPRTEKKDTLWSEESIGTTSQACYYRSLPGYREQLQVSSIWVQSSSQHNLHTRHRNL